MDRLIPQLAQLRRYERILRENPDDAPARLGLARCLARSPGLALHMQQPDLLLQALSWEQVDPQQVASATAARLRVDPHEPLLLTMLSEVIVTDRDLERRLTDQRRSLCLDPPRHPPALGVALAAQGRLNEFVWSIEADEQQRLPDAPKWVADMYTPTAHAACVAQHIPALTEVPEGNSQAVRQQYEANPYPRWRRLTHVPPEPIGERLHRLLGGAWTPPASLKRPEVLVVGCGTGQDLLSAAQSWQPESVTGVDLSQTSLAHAQVMATRYGLPVELHQADLLLLDGWGRQFDVIVCTGVLHHLDDPLQGWRILVGLLRPGGVMQIGLYSQTARQGIVAAQNEVTSRGFLPTLEGIRAARQHLNGLSMDHPAQDCALLLDYFHTSGCRDLLFHVQEHRFTIVEIERALADLGLRFLDFDTPPGVRQLYQTLFGVGPSLRCWEALERMYPRTFLGMYRFWVQKAA